MLDYLLLSNAKSLNYFFLFFLILFNFLMPKENMCQGPPHPVMFSQDGSSYYMHPNGRSPPPPMFSNAPHQNSTMMGNPYMQPMYQFGVYAGTTLGGPAQPIAVPMPSHNHFSNPAANPYPPARYYSRSASGGNGGGSMMSSMGMMNGNGYDRLPIWFPSLHMTTSPDRARAS